MTTEDSHDPESPSEDRTGNEDAARQPAGSPLTPPGGGSSVPAPPAAPAAPAVPPAPPAAPPAPRLTDSPFGVKVAAVVGVLLLAVYVVTTLFLIDDVLTDNPADINWQRAINLFQGLETIAFAAVAFIFGREVNRVRAETAEASAAQTQTQLQHQTAQSASLQAKSTIEERRAAEAAVQAELHHEKGRLLADAVRSKGGGGGPERAPWDRAQRVVMLDADDVEIQRLDAAEWRSSLLHPPEDDYVVALANRLFPSNG